MASKEWIYKQIGIIIKIYTFNNFNNWMEFHLNK